MKKFLKISVPIFILLFLVVFVLYSNFHYSHNTKLIEYFEEHRTLLSDYAENFDSENFSDKYSDEAVGEIREYDIPQELKEVNISKIEYFNSRIYFEINILDAYYGGIYYSFNNHYEDASPLYCSDTELFNSDFDEVNKGIFVKGKKNSGTNWCKTEKLTDNWCYYEFHQA